MHEELNCPMKPSLSLSLLPSMHLCSSWKHFRYLLCSKQFFHFVPLLLGQTWPARWAALQEPGSHMGESSQRHGASSCVHAFSGARSSACAYPPELTTNNEVMSKACLFMPFWRILVKDKNYCLSPHQTFDWVSRNTFKMSLEVGWVFHQYEQGWKVFLLRLMEVSREARIQLRLLYCTGIFLIHSMWLKTYQVEDRVIRLCGVLFCILNDLHGKKQNQDLCNQASVTNLLQFILLNLYENKNIVFHF